jgi:hypothetical protein
MKKSELAEKAYQLGKEYENRRLVIGRTQPPLRKREDRNGSL